MVDPDTAQLFDDVLSRAIQEVRANGIDVFTFAFYHDHESGAVSICVDSEQNSIRSVRLQNAFRIKHFADAVARGDLRKAALLKSNAGRNLSLGDFVLVNFARTSIGSIQVDASFYLQMIRSLRLREGEIAGMCSDIQRLIFCCSSAELEVGYTWVAAPAAV